MAFSDALALSYRRLVGDNKDISVINCTQKTTLGDKLKKDEETGLYLAINIDLKPQGNPVTKK